MPWIMKAGKALNERKVEIRVQYKPPAAAIHPNLNEMRNELVVSLLYVACACWTLLRNCLADCWRDYLPCWLQKRLSLQNTVDVLSSCGTFLDTGRWHVLLARRRAAEVLMLCQLSVDFIPLGCI